MDIHNELIDFNTALDSRSGIDDLHRSFTDIFRYNWELNFVFSTSALIEVIDSILIPLLLGKKNLREFGLFIQQESYEFDSGEYFIDQGLVDKPEHLFHNSFDEAVESLHSLDTNQRLFVLFYYYRRRLNKYDDLIVTNDSLVQHYALLNEFFNSEMKNSFRDYEPEIVSNYLNVFELESHFNSDPAESNMNKVTQVAYSMALYSILNFHGIQIRETPYKVDNEYDILTELGNHLKEKINDKEGIKSILLKFSDEPINMNLLVNELIESLRNLKLEYLNKGSAKRYLSRCFDLESSMKLSSEKNSEKIQKKLRHFPSLISQLSALNIQAKGFFYLGDKK